MLNKILIALILTTSFTFAYADPTVRFRFPTHSYNPGPPNPQVMQELGKSLKDKRVREVFFVHGTFVGGDGSGLVSLFSDLLNMNLEEQVKRLKDKGFEDTGNYTAGYVDEFCSLIANDICEGANSSRFIWSSGDYHKARLVGAIMLADKVADQIRAKAIKENERILLIGHSHAGQVFALLTNLLADVGNPHSDIYRFVDEHKDNLIQASRDEDKRTLKRLRSNIADIRKINLDFVTFGTPVRYAWKSDSDSKSRLMTVINHRGPSKIGGLLTVRDGDYVQQWGVEGTDMPLKNFLEQEKEIEAKLAKILNDKAGFNPDLNKILSEELRRSPRNITSVANYLIDYKDGSEYQWEFPNYMIEKVIGHGVYTKQEAMQYNTKLIVDTLYSSDSM